MLFKSSGQQERETTQVRTHRHLWPLCGETNKQTRKLSSKVSIISAIIHFSKQQRQKVSGSSKTEHFVPSFLSIF